MEFKELKSGWKWCFFLTIFHSHLGRWRSCYTIETGTEKFRNGNRQIGLVLVYHSEWLCRRKGTSIRECKLLKLSHSIQTVYNSPQFYSTWRKYATYRRRIVVIHCPIGNVNCFTSRRATQRRVDCWKGDRRCRMWVCCREVCWTTQPVRTWKMTSKRWMCQPNRKRRRCATIILWICLALNRITWTYWTPSLQWVWFCTLNKNDFLQSIKAAKIHGLLSRLALRTWHSTHSIRFSSLSLSRSRSSRLCHPIPSVQFND